MSFPECAKKRKFRFCRLFLELFGVAFMLCALACCAGCAESNTRKTQNDIQSYEELSSIATSWLYFDADGNLTVIDNPSAIPSPGFRPWTEAPAVMDAGIAGNSPVLLVNKKGALSAETLASLSPNGAFSVPEGIFPSAAALSSGTLASFAFEGGKTFARFYRSVVFDSDRSSQPVALFLCGEAPYFPLESPVLASSFGAKKDAQFVSLNYTGKNEPWVAAFKSRVGIASGVSFEYFALSALPGSPGFSSRSISAVEFQALSESASSESPPQAFAALLALVPASARVSIQIAGEGFPETREFATGGQGESLAAWGFEFEGGAAVLFSDGTFYFAKKNSGTVKALRFPRLNSGYTYTAFVFSDEGILAGWEERRFYETGRSGIIAVSVPAGFFR